MDTSVWLAIALITAGVLLFMFLAAVFVIFAFWRIRRRRAAQRAAAGPARSAAPAASVPPSAQQAPSHAPPASAPPTSAPPMPLSAQLAHELDEPFEDDPTMRMPAGAAPPHSGPPVSQPPPPPPQLQGQKLLGFFDDDMATGGTADAARTELFQRGAQAFDWDDDDEDEGGATEVFSAHHAEELGSDFTIEEEPDK